MPHEHRHQSLIYSDAITGADERGNSSREAWQRQDERRLQNNEMEDASHQVRVQLGSVRGCSGLLLLSGRHIKRGFQRVTEFQRAARDGRNFDFIVGLQQGELPACS